MNVEAYSMPDDVPSRGARRRLFWFVFHLVCYSVVMALVVVVNMIVAPTHPWFALIFFGWCGFVILHVRALVAPGVHRISDTQAFVNRAGRREAAETPA